MSNSNFLLKKKLVEYLTKHKNSFITEKSICLDDLSRFGEFLICYRLSIIRCWQNKQLGIIGVQLHYRDRDTNDEVISMNKIKNTESTLV